MNLRRSACIWGRLPEFPLQDRSLRSLARLQNSGATSRVLNLNRVHQQYGQTEAHRNDPFFRHPLLNKALVVKHRLREHEADLFEDYRTNATKLILPIDREDLRSGGRYAFVGQKDFDVILLNLLGDNDEAHEDRKTLDILSRLPSFDPFLMREHLRRFDVLPAPCYFDISPGDLARMFAFLQEELRELVQLSLGDLVADRTDCAALLADKILSNSAGEDMEPLRLTLRLARDEYVEGVFCWKGFLYYKWKLGELRLGAPALVREIKSVETTGPTDPATREYVTSARDRIIRAIQSSRQAVEETLAVYDHAYQELTRAGEPLAFRTFLLQAPAMFLRLGEKLGVIDHIVSFWTYRFPPGHPTAASPLELMDIFLDFEESLGLSTRDTGRSWGGRDFQLAG
jgi:hypothetical protein